MNHHSKCRILSLLLLPVLVWLVAPSDALAQNPTGDNAVNGGFGFQVGMSRWTPGGFKWFNSYNRRFTDLVWLNVQLNTTIGGGARDDRCWYDRRRDRWHCDEGHWRGSSLEFAVGVKLRFELQKIPAIIDARLCAASELLFFGEFSGATVAFRGGPGFHWFFFDNLGAGVEFNFTLGPAFTDYEGTVFYGAFDFQIIGVEFRF
jgi:hypothetical protein